MQPAALLGSGFAVWHPFNAGELLDFEPDGLPAPDKLFKGLSRHVPSPSRAP
jgi:hypothetical protein